MLNIATVHLYMCISKYYNLMWNVILHNDLIGCNYCDTSSPHNAMHSSSYFTILVILTQTVKVTNTVKITWHDDGLL